MTNPTTFSVWQQLIDHQHEVFPLHMRDLFAQDENRFNKFSLKCGDLLFDYSKHRITDETLPLLFQLARDADVGGWRERMFSGEKINFTTDGRVNCFGCQKNLNTPNNLIFPAGKDIDFIITSDRMIKAINFTEPGDKVDEFVFWK